MLRHHDEDEIGEWLEHYDLRGWLEPRAGEAAEAWIPVTIAGAARAELRPFSGRDAILTYQNSD
jgi:hypothetical protein